MLFNSYSFLFLFLPVSLALFYGLIRLGLRRYIFDPEARRRAVAAGQALVQREWTLPLIADQWRRYFDGFRERAPRR